MADEHIVQIRFPNDPRSYAPDRDIAWIFPMVMEVARQSLSAEHLEPWVETFLKENGVGERELAQAYRRFAEGVEADLRVENAHPNDSLTTAGFFAAPPAAKFAVFAALGMAVASIAHVHMRRASMTRDSLELRRLLGMMAEEGRRGEAEARRRSP